MRSIPSARANGRGGHRPRFMRTATVATVAGLVAALSATCVPAFAATPETKSAAIAASVGSAQTTPASTAGGASAAPGDATAASAGADLPAQLTASAQARATGKPVTVASLTTETTLVTADPSGDFTMTSTVLPVRVQKNGVWTPIDTTLAANPDGTYSPVASALPLTFSGGGDSPLITVTAPGGSSGTSRGLAISWPTALPQPTISGNVAVYPGVLPGVDLRLDDTGDSYREVLVVHNAAAAANPALAALRMNIAATGLTVRKNADGSLSAVDPAGDTVLSGTAPDMWDSTDNPDKGPVPTPDNPGSGDFALLGTSLSGGAVPEAAATIAGAKATTATTITLTPPAGALTGPGKTFPEYIDPTFGNGQSSWVTVDNVGDHWLNGSGSGNVQVGDCNWTGTDPCNPVGVFRAYFAMKTPALDGSGSNGTTATVSSANFTITQMWNGEKGCTATPVDLYGSGAVSGSTTWPGPITTYVGTASSGAGNGCNPASISIAAKSIAQSAANGKWSTTTLALRAPDESTLDQWKQFDVNPVLTVDYAYPPNAASALDVTGVSCNGKFYVNDTTPTLTAKATDNNSPALNTKLTFTINGHTGTADPASGAVGSWTVTPALAANTSYTYTVAVSNGILSAPSVSTSGAFTVLAPPPTAPTITSSDYPPKFWGQPTNTGGQLTVTSPDPNLQGFVYSLTGASTEKAADATTCDTTRVVNNNSSGQLTDGFVPTTSGTAAVQVPAGLSPGYHTLNVKSVDFANNESPDSATYAFYVSPAVSSPSADLALSKAVTVSSTVATGSWPASNLTNGVLRATSTDLGWSSLSHTTAAGTEWAEVNLGSAQSIDDVDLYPRDDPANNGSGFPSAFTIATSTDNSTWTTVDTEVAAPKPGDSPQRYSFPATTAQYIKVTATALRTDSIGSVYYMQLKQIAVYNGVTSNRYQAEDSNELTGAAHGSGTYTQVQSSYTGWADGAQLFFAGTAQGNTDTLTFTVPSEGDYAVGADMTAATDYGQVAFSVDDTALTANGQPTFDGYRSSCCSTTYVQLGGVHLTAGSHTLTMTLTGTNAASVANRYNAGVDYLTVAEINGATDANFGAAMNNNGIADTDSAPSTANFDLTFGTNALSAKALATAGVSTTAPIVVDGDSFRLTPANAAGYDNVIALGQTIDNPVPTTSPNSSIALLVAATAGPIKGGQVTVTYTDGTDSQATLGTVPDWATPIAGINPAVALPTYDTGANATPTTGVRDLYAVAVPTDASKTIASVTLPTYSSSMLPSSGANSLHVLAIGTHAASGTGTVGGVAVNWIGTWAAPSDTTTGTIASPAFTNQTLREVISPSTLGTGTGAEARIRLTVPRGASAATFGAATLAAQAAGTGPGTLAAPAALTFGGSPSVTVNPGTEIYSDPVVLPSTAGGSGDLVVSLAVAGTAAIAPEHTDASTAGAGPAGYLAAGDATGDQAGAPGTWTAGAADWYYLEDVDVTTTDTTQGTVVVLGDQTSLGTGADGRGWADDLPAALADPGNATVIDRTPGGVVDLSTNGATTTSTLTNLATTIEDEPNVRTVIIDLGTNDLTGGVGYTTIENNLTTLVDTLSARQFGSGAVNVYLTTIVPDATTAFTSAQETTRELVNDDITAPSSWGYAGYIDFDNVVTGCGTGNSGTPHTPLASLLTGGVPNSAYYLALANGATSPAIPTGVGPLVRGLD